MGYRIKTVSELTGIPKNTLIAWERRHELVTPSRTSSGYREYSDEDVALLRRVKQLTDSGLKISEVVSLLAEEAEATADPVAPVVTGLAPEAAEGEAFEVLRDELMQRLLAFDRAGAEAITRRLLVVPFETVVDEVYFPLLHEVGDAWLAGTVTVVQEHYVTAYCREKLLVMLHSVRTSEVDAPEITLATPPGENHELGLLALALRLVLRGFRVVYLGASVPTAQLCDHVIERGAAALCLSLVHARPVAQVQAYAMDLRRRLPDQVRIVLGGRGVPVDELEPVPGVLFAGDALPSWLERPNAWTQLESGRRA